MRVPIRKPGKYTHLKTDPQITAAKFKELESELLGLKKNIRPSLAEEVKRLAEMGDFSENAAYQIAKGRLRGLNQRILDIEDLLKRAEIIQASENNELVRIGCFVIVEVAGKQKKYQILGSVETDPGSGVISHNSPLGSALLGKRAGDSIKIKLANKIVEYKIIKIE